MDLKNVVRHKILNTTDKESFEKDLNTLTDQGWKVVNIQTTVTWSESMASFMTSYLAVLVKAGI